MTLDKFISYDLSQPVNKVIKQNDKIYHLYSINLHFVIVYLIHHFHIHFLVSLCDIIFLYLECNYSHYK